MQNLIDESTRRRKIQEEYNRRHQIKPQSVYKSMDEIMQSTAVADSAAVAERSPKYQRCGDEFGLDDKAMVVDIMRLEMLKAAENLQFEQAATLRDEINKLEKEIAGTVKI